jgi:hypothetical protein
MADQTKKTTSSRSSTRTQNQTTENNVDLGSASGTAMSEPTSKPNQITGMNQEKEDGLTQHVRSTASEAYDSAASKAAQKLEEQKAVLSVGLSNAATNFRKLGQDLEATNADDRISRIMAEYSQLAANKLESAVGYFENKDVNAVYRDVESMARQYPAWFVGGAFAFGFLAARFLKSSNGRSYSSSDMSYRPNTTGQTRRLGTEMRSV